MPIRFRCGYCNKLLGIARRKAGSEITCPHCGYTVTVPEEDPANDQTQQSEFEDLDSLLNPASAREAPDVSSPPPSDPDLASSPPSDPDPPVATLPQTAAAQAAAAALAATPRPAPPAARSPSSIPFGGAAPAPTAGPDKPKPVPSTGIDSRLPESGNGQIVLSAQKAAGLAVLMVILLGLAFAGGFLVATQR